MRWLRGLPSYLVFFLALPFLLFHPKLRQGKRARLGFIQMRRRTKAPRIWVHGASAGDIQALLSTVRELRRRLPNLEVIASTITDSGRAMAERLQQDFTAVTYLPYDIPGAVQRSLRAINPDLLVLEYTELWPQLIHTARRLKVPVILHNGRIAETKVAWYRRLFWLTGNLLKQLNLLLMRNESEAERATALGAPRERVVVTGDTKFDNLSVMLDPAKIEALRAAVNLDANDLVFVAGSTHEGEEEPLLAIFSELRVRFATLRMIVAPRYVDRAERLLALAQRHNLRARLRSNNRDNSRADVIVLDTIGELAPCYALASLVFVGGSLIPHGGHNILEPAACGKPVMFGPHMDNFAEPLQLLLGHGGIQCANPQQLREIMLDLLDRPSYREELGRLAKQQVLKVRGAAGRNADRIVEMLAG